MARIHVVSVVDESSSMGHLQKATIDGFNEYMDELRKDEEAAEDTYISLVKFSSSVSVVFENQKLSNVEPLTTKSYVPNGMTALFDGIARGVSVVDPKVAPEDKVVVLVQTDGAENYSRESTRETILKTIEDREGRGNWTFVYLGAGIPEDQLVTASAGIGVGAANTVSYGATAQGTQGTYSSLASNTIAYRGKSAKRSSKSFLTEDKTDD